MCTETRQPAAQKSLSPFSTDRTLLCVITGVPAWIRSLVSSACHPGRQGLVLLHTHTHAVAACEQQLFRMVL